MFRLRLIFSFFLLFCTNFTYGHICDDVFRQFERLIVRPETDVIRIKEQGEFRIFVQNNMDRPIAVVRIEGISKEFDFEIKPKEYRPLPRSEPKYFTVRLILKKGVQPGRYPISFKVMIGGEEVKRLDLAVHATLFQEIFCPKTGIIPKIDGILNDACWKYAEKITNFVINKEAKLADVQTIVFLTCDNKNLYLGFCCVEPNVDKLVEKVKIFDGRVYDDDSVGIFLGKTEKPNIYHYIFVNSKSTICDAKVNLDLAKIDMKWNSDVIARTSKKNNAWFVELALPLTNFITEKNTVNLNSLYMNFVRVRKAGEKKEVSFWRYMAGRIPIYFPEKFSKVIFSR